MKSLYLQLLEKCLTNSIYREVEPTNTWPKYAHTMMPASRLDNIYQCATKIIEDNVPGDFIECGAWRGGATIYMRAILHERNIGDRKVIVADSFQGFRRPQKRIDPDCSLHTQLLVSLDQVKENFQKYDLLDDQVVFLPGWFEDTLPGWETPLSLLRIDCNYYELVRLVLNELYPWVSPGGFVIIDDYDIIPGCNVATDEFVAEHHIQYERMEKNGVFWRKP